MTNSEIVTSLLASGDRQADLHRKAAELRDREFGKTVFVRGVVEVSNYCRENCSYCGMRRDNRSLSRFRLDFEPLLELLLNHRPASITDLNFQAGEDPIVVRELVIPLLRELRAHTNLGLSVCLGTLSERDYAALREAGASFYIIKLETGDPAHYRTMASPGNLDERLAAIRHLAVAGWDVSSGLIVGLPGQTPEMMAATIAMLRDLPLVGNSVSPFIPGNETLWPDHPAAPLDLAINAVATMRLLNPDRIIPAVSAMTLVGHRGYGRALAAGANLTTINLTPPGPRQNYLLYTRERNIMTEERIIREIADAGCVPSQVGLSTALSQRRACPAAA